VLSLAGGLLGGVIAVFGLEPFAASFPGGLPRTSEIGVDMRVLLMATAFALATGLLIGILPARRSARTSLGEALGSADRGYAGERRRNRAQATLVVAQVALAFSLLVGAGLLLKSFLLLVAVDYGFEAENRIVMSVVLPEPYRSSVERTRLFYEELGERLSALPGVEVVGTASQLPFVGGTSWPPVLVETSDGEVEAAIHAVSATPSYFTAMEVPLLAGRALSTDDREGTEPVIVINETMARRYWPDETPLGRHITLEGFILEHDEVESISLTIVGVVADFRYAHSAPPFVTYWFPFAQYPYYWQTFVIRTATDSAATIAPARAALREMDPNIPSLIGRYDEIIASAPGVTRPRFGAFATGLLATIAAFLALLGIYGILASTVAQRTHEIGIRIALGARKEALLRAVLRRALVLATVGMAIGLGVALLAARVLESLLFEISATDPLTLLQVGVLVLVASLAAGYFPARRATRVDPVEALRHD
jgi:putative ABC transport system permease protein